MKINELETQLELSRANIRFYEKEGLLTPSRNENGYREYSPEDVEVLKKIIIFRKLGLSIPEIKDILDGKTDLSFAINQNIENLHRQIAELNGALEVSKTIQTDNCTNDNFNTNHYWNLIHTKEENGESFADLLNDYVNMEKNAFLAMWEGPFFLAVRKEVKKYGWKAVLLALLALCVIRGIAQELFWPGGSFFEGFSYPFFLFGIMSIIVLPIFFLHRKYKDYEPEEETPQKHPKLVGFCKGFALFVYFIAYLFLVPRISEDIFTPFHNNMTYHATFGLYFIYWLVGMYVFALLVFLYSKHGIFPDRISGEEGIKANIPKKEKHKLTAFSFILLFASIVLSCCWYDCFTEDGLIIQRIHTSKEYTWEEIDYYTLSASSSGTLTFTVVMQDGTHSDCIGGNAIVWMCNLPEEKYPDYEYDFVKFLSRKFTEQGVELRVDNWEKLYKKLQYDSWKELAEEIREIAEQ